MEVDVFENKKAVLTFLKGENWKISQRTLYRHIKEGRLRPNKDGKFDKKAVLRYASDSLLSVGAFQKVGDEKLYRLKLQKEIELRDEEIKIRKLRRGVEEGKYMPSEQVYLELAGRAVVLQAGYKSWVQMEAAGEIIALCKGDPATVNDLVWYLLDKFDGFLNQYATTKEFQVIIMPDEGIDSNEN